MVSVGGPIMYSRNAVYVGLMGTACTEMSSSRVRVPVGMYDYDRCGVPHIGVAALGWVVLATGSFGWSPSTRAIVVVTSGEGVATDQGCS